MRKKGFIVLIGLLLLLTGFLFASGGDEKTTELSMEETITISYMTTTFVNSELKKENFALKIMQEKTNMELDIQTVSGAEYQQKLNLLIASGALPDVFNGPLSVMSEYYEEDIVYELTDLIPQYAPNAVKVVEEAGDVMLRNWKTDDSKIYWLPKIGYKKNSTTEGIYMPWLDKLGMDVPTTTDELYEVLKGFKTLGDNIIPMTRGYFGYTITPILLAYGTSNSWIYFGGDDYVFGPYERADELKEALGYLKKLYDEELLDVEFLSLSLDDYFALVRNERTGFVYGWWGGPMWKLDDEGKRRSPMVTDWEPMAPVAGPKGERWARVGSLLGGTYFISKKAPAVERILNMFNFIYSDEGRHLFDWGVEGETYNVVNGEKVYVEEIMTADKGAMNAARDQGLMPVNFPAVVSLDAVFGVWADKAKKDMKNHMPYYLPQQPVIVGTTTEASRLATLFADINTYVAETIPKFITGDLSISDDWDAYLAELKRMKIQEALDIQHGIFKRWQAR